MAAISQILGNVRIWPGPILAVELITTSRRTWYFVFRVLYAAALLLALCFTRLVTLGPSADDLNATAQFTSAFFATFGVMQLMAILLIGPALAAGTIARERERRTMEYLYTTPLSNLEIIIGKLGGRVLQILYLVLSGMPVLALAMLLGGIAPQSIAALTAITLSTIVFVTMVSMAVSAWTAKARDAVIGAYVVFFCLWILPFLLSPLLSRFGAPWIHSLMAQIFAANPIEAFVGILFGQGPWGPMVGPWELLLVLVRNQMLLGAPALLLATVFMRRIHLRELGKPARTPRRRTRLLRSEMGDDPVYWKELYAQSGSSRRSRMGYGLLVLVVFAACGYALYAALDSVGNSSQQGGEFYCYYAIGMSTFLNCCGLLVVIVRAAGSITSEKERDCWYSLISTPLEPKQIIRAKILGSLWPLRGLAPPLAVVWLPALLLRPSLFFGIAFSLLNLGILAAFAAALGVQCSLRSKSTLRATGAALGIAVVIGGVLPSCCCLATPLSPPYLLAWPGIASLMFGSWSLEFLGTMVVFLAGTIGYAVAAVLMTLRAIGQFDQISGRTQKWPVIRQLPSGSAVSAR